MTCPICATPYAVSGEPNCWCDADETPVREQPFEQQLATLGRRMRAASLDQHDIPTFGAVKPSTDLPHRATTTQQLVDLVDIVANLALRLTTSTPGVEQVRAKRPPAEGAPVNVTVLHALDDRVKYTGDAMPEYLADETWQCQHHSHHPNECPHGSDGDGRQGVLPDLWVWARMIEADLTEADPKLPEELPDPVTMATVASWLVEHHERWGDHFPQEADEFAKDVKRWHNRLRAELGEHDPPTLRHGGVGGCGYEMAQLADQVRYECRGCREVLTMPEMLSLAKWNSAVTLAEAHELLAKESSLPTVPLSTLKHWAKTGRIEAATQHRPKLYWLRDITHEAKRVRGAS